MSRPPHVPSNSLNFSDCLRSIVASESERFFNNLLISIVVHAADGRVAYCNEAAQSLFGPITESPIAPDNWVYWSQLYLVGTETPYPPARLPATQALQGQSVCLQDLELHRDDGRIRLQANALPVRNEQGQITHVIVAFEDITDRAQPTVETQAPDSKSLEHQAMQSEAILRAIPDLIVRLGRDGRFISRVRNNPDIDILLPGDEPIGCPLEDYLSATAAAQHLDYIQKALDDRTVQMFEQVLSVQGRTQYEEVRIVPCGPDEVLEIIRDISDRKLLEQSLRQQEEQHRRIIEALPDLMFRVTCDGYRSSYVRTNATIDYIADDYDPIGQHLSEHMPAEVAQQQLEKIRLVATTGQMQVFEQQLRVNGRVQHEEVRIIPYSAEEVLFIVRNITDRKATELALQQSEAENRAIVAAMPDLMFRLHRDGTFLGYCKSGKTHDLLENVADPVGHNIFDFADTYLHQKTHIERKMQVVSQVLATGEMQVYEQQTSVNGDIQYE
ncbi:MAG: PAS domain-containing protein, partial [Cyanobacteria bacterium P01_H01_bin.162]